MNTGTHTEKEGKEGAQSCRNQTGNGDRTQAKSSGRANADSREDQQEQSMRAF